MTRSTHCFDTLASTFPANEEKKGGGELTEGARSEGVFGDGKQHGVVSLHPGGLGGGPGDTVGRPAGNPGDFDALQAVHEGGLAVHRRVPVALLSVVVVSPGVHLRRMCAPVGMVQFIFRCKAFLGSALSGFVFVGYSLDREEGGEPR